MRGSWRAGAALAVLVLATFLGSCSTAAAAPEAFSVSDWDAFPGKDRPGHPEDVASLRRLRSGMLRTAKSVGATHVRIWVWWQYIDGCNAAQRQHRMDELLTSITQVKAAGLIPMLSFTGVAATDWGKRENWDQCSALRQRPTGFNPSVTDYGWFVAYVANTVLRPPYNVRIFETYNEPDHPTFLCVLPETLPHKRTHQPVPAHFIDGTAAAGTGQVAGRVPVAEYDLGYARKSGSKIVRKKCATYQDSLAVKRFRALHNAAVRAIEDRAHNAGIADPRSEITILLGDVSGAGFGFLTHVFKEPSKLLAVDGVAVHSYLKLSQAPSLDQFGRLVSKCEPVRPAKRNGRLVDVPDMNYLGMECLARVHNLLHKRAPTLEDQVWVTEAGLPVAISATIDNIGRALDRMYDAPGVRMINWYDIQHVDDNWQTWINDSSNWQGDESDRGTAMHDWSLGKFLPTSDDWRRPGAPDVGSCSAWTETNCLLPPSARWWPNAPGLVPCDQTDNVDDRATWTETNANCTMPPPLPVQW